MRRFQAIFLRSSFQNDLLVRFLLKKAENTASTSDDQREPRIPSPAQELNSIRGCAWSCLVSKYCSRRSVRNLLPSAGPKNGESTLRELVVMHVGRTPVAYQMATATARYSGVLTSLIVPAPTARGAAPIAPERKRQTSSVPVFRLRPAPTWKSRATGVTTRYTGRLPYVSEIPDAIMGPAASPRT